jgi:hypothetical protein
MAHSRQIRGQVWRLTVSNLLTGIFPAFPAGDSYQMVTKKNPGIAAGV